MLTWPKKLINVLKKIANHHLTMQSGHKTFSLQQQQQKMQYLHSGIKWDTIRWGVLVLKFRSIHSSLLAYLPTVPITNAMDMNLDKLWEMVRDRKTWHAAIHGGHKELDTIRQLNTTTSRILSLCLFNLYAEYIMWNAMLDEPQPGIKTARRNINNLRYVDDTTLMAESKEELKSLLMRWKRRVKELA